MRFDILTIFPSSFDSYFSESIIKRAQKNKLIKICTHDIRKFSKDKHKKVDDIPFGGGAGMVMTPQPLYDAIKHVKKLNKGAVIFLSPSGEIFTQIKAERLAKKYEKTKNKGLILICGRYEGVDERVAGYVADEVISIGDYVLNGGEVAAMAVIESVSRMVPMFIAKKESAEKFDHPQYTRPETFVVGKKKLKVPKVLLSGDHKKIQEWRERHKTKVLKLTRLLT